VIELFIKRRPHALTLHEGAGERLTSILNNAADSIEGLRVMAHILNSSGTRENNLIDAPLKRYDRFIEKLDMASDILLGPVNVRLGWNGESVMMNFVALLANPIADLKTQLPTVYDRRGDRFMTFPDWTFGGTIPNADLITTYCEIGEDFVKLRLPVVCP